MTAPAVVGVHSLDDDSLAQHVTRRRRAIQDGDRGDHHAGLAAARCQQLARARLRMRYGAVDNDRGCDSGDAYRRLGAAPTYRLAALMDRWRWQHGQSSVLAWEAHADVLPRSPGRRRPATAP